MLEVVVPEKRFEIGAIWLKGCDSSNQYFVLCDMVEGDIGCLEIWEKVDERM